MINISRVEMYKPIQVAELLREMRSNPKIDPNKLESYRSLSRRLRDHVTLRLFGKVSTSSMQFQDNLWNENAIPAAALSCLSKINKNNGAVEEHIYQRIYEKSELMMELRKSILKLKTIEDFKSLINGFNIDGLRTSADRLLEIVTLCILNFYLDDSKLVLKIVTEKNNIPGVTLRKIFERESVWEQRLEFAKLGHTNAADAGMDLWSNFGIVVSVKNYRLDLSLFDGILLDSPVGKLVIVCEEVSPEVAALTGSNMNLRDVTILTVAELLHDVETLIANDTSCKNFADSLLVYFDREFPQLLTLVDFMNERGYHVRKPGQIIDLGL